MSLSLSRLRLGLSSGASFPFSIALTGLTDGEARIGDHASIGYTIDPDGGTETVAWGTTAGDDTYGTSANPSDYTAGDEGQLVLTVTDGGRSRSISAPIRHAPGTAPAIADGQSWTVDDTSVNIDASASGANLTFSYALSGAPAGVTINSGTGAITGTPTAVASGTATVTATDQYGRTLDDTFTFTSTLRAQATGGADLDLSFTVDEAVTATDLTANWTTNGNTLTYAITGTALPAGLSVDSAGELTGTPTALTADATYTLRGTDEYGRTTDDTFTLEVVEASSFEESDLFANSETGLLYGPSTSTSFLAPDNLTPASATNAVGFQLDESQGAGYSGSAFTGLGSELSANPGDPFVNTTNVSPVSSTLSVASDLLVITATASSFSSARWDYSGLTPNAWYFLQIRARGDGASPRVWNNSGWTGSAIRSLSASMSTITYFVQATGTTASISVYANVAGGSVGDIAEVEFVTVKELPGFHGAQSNSSFRSLLQATPDRLAFDSIDDRLTTALNPTATGSIAARFRGGTASRIAVGSQGASDGRAYIGLASDGSVAGGVGTQATSTIKGSTDQRGEWVTVTLTWNGTTVKLYENGVEVYSAAQSGAVNTTVPFMVGALNANGTASAFWDDDISHVIITDDVITAAEAASLHTLWSA